jgi:hypothetical protein
MTTTVDTIRSVIDGLKTIGQIGVADRQVFASERQARIAGMRNDPAFRHLSVAAIEERVDTEMHDRGTDFPTQQRQRVSHARRAYEARIAEVTADAEQTLAQARRIPMPAPPIPRSGRVSASISTDVDMQVAILRELRTMTMTRRSDDDRRACGDWSAETLSRELTRTIPEIRRLREALAPVEQWLDDEAARPPSFARKSPQAPPNELVGYDTQRERLTELERRAAVLQDLLEMSRPMPVNATVDAVVAHQAAESRRKALATDIGALWLGEAGLQRERETRAALQELRQAWSVAGMGLAVMDQIGEPLDTGDAA